VSVFELIQNVGKSLNLFLMYTKVHEGSPGLITSTRMCMLVTMLALWPLVQSFIYQHLLRAVNVV